MLKISLFLIIIFFLYNIPLASSDMHAVQIDNKTVLINITNNNSINVPSLNTSGIEKLIKQVGEKNGKWGEGDILIVSGTIFAFFSLGSFLVDRFEGKNKNEQMKVMQVILGLTGGVQSIHLIVIITIVLNVFNPLFYVAVIALTIFVLFIMFAAVRELFLLHTSEKETKDEFLTDPYSKLETYFDKIREEKKQRLEEGE